MSANVPPRPLIPRLPLSPSRGIQGKPEKNGGAHPSCPPGGEGGIHHPPAHPRGASCVAPIAVRAGALTRLHVELSFFFPTFCKGAFLVSRRVLRRLRRQQVPRLNACAFSTQYPARGVCVSVVFLPVQLC